MAHRGAAACWRHTWHERTLPAAVVAHGKRSRALGSAAVSWQCGAVRCCAVVLRRSGEGWFRTRGGARAWRRAAARARGDTHAGARHACIWLSTLRCVRLCCSCCVLACLLVLGGARRCSVRPPQRTPRRSACAACASRQQRATLASAVKIVCRIVHFAPRVYPYEHQRPSARARSSDSSVAAQRASAAARQLRHSLRATTNRQVAVANTAPPSPSGASASVASSLTLRPSSDSTRTVAHSQRPAGAGAL
jgi:hypothetical protein